MNSQAQPFYGKGVYTPMADPSRMLMWDATQMLMEGLMGHEGDLPRLLEMAHNLTCILENTRASYNSALSDRDATYRKLQETDNKLLQIENVVRRYSTVREPVVASDGYTYDRSAITQYLQDCARTNSKAYSQQTKEELTDVLVPNESLRRLVDTLKGIRTTEVPQLHPRNPITVAPPAPRGHAWADDIAAMALNPVGTVEAPNRLAAAEQSATPASAPSGPNPVAAAGNPIGGVQIPAPAGARRFDAGGNGGRFGKHGGPKPALHPCLRVYGFCNFMEDCTFAHYPYEACLNHIKGKCRFGQNCKELHVDPRDPAYQNRNSYAATHNHPKQQQDGHGSKKSGDSDGKTATETSPQDKNAAASTPSESGSKTGTPSTIGHDNKDASTKAEPPTKPTTADEA